MSRRAALGAVLAVALAAVTVIAARGFMSALAEVGPLLDEMNDGPGWAEED